VFEFQNQENETQKLTNKQSAHYDFQRACLKSLGSSFIQIESIDTMVRYVFDLSDTKIDWELFMYFEEDFQESLLNLPSLGHKVKLRSVDNSRKLRILNLMIKPLSQFLPVFEDSLVANGDAVEGLRVTFNDQYGNVFDLSTLVDQVDQSPYGNLPGRRPKTDLPVKLPTPKQATSGFHTKSCFQHDRPIRKLSPRVIPKIRVSKAEL